MKAELKNIVEKFNKLEDLNVKASDAINKAKEGAIKNIVKVKRKGKEVEVTEKDLWDEVYNGAQTDAPAILKAKYPEPFDLSEEANTLADEIHKTLAKDFDLPTDKRNLVSFGKLLKFIIRVIEEEDEVE